MSNIQTQQSGDRVIIRIRGDFTFDINRAFRDAYQSYPAGTRYEVDLSETSYMDSAGLGMLVQLREYTGSDQKLVTLKGANPTIQSILEVANFPRLFDIS